MLDIFVCEAFAARALSEPNAFAQSFVVGFAVSGVQRADRVATLDTDRHCRRLVERLYLYASRGRYGDWVAVVVIAFVET